MIQQPFVYVATGAFPRVAYGRRVLASVVIDSDSVFELQELSAIVGKRIARDFELEFFLAYARMVPWSLKYYTLPRPIYPALRIQPATIVQLAVSHAYSPPWYRFWERWSTFPYYIQLRGSKLYSKGAETPVRTPGPWRNDGTMVYGRGAEAIAQVVMGTGDLANARLIAAAPELLEALNVLKVDYAESEGCYCGQLLDGTCGYCKATTAIAHAEGAETPVRHKTENSSEVAVRHETENTEGEV